MYLLFSEDMKKEVRKYIKGGTINWNYNGTATYNGKQYNVKGGIAQ